MRILFVCTANKFRSPTAAETLFKGLPGIDCLSAGTAPGAPVPLTQDLVASADYIFAMETYHRELIRRKFKVRPPDGRIINLGISDEYERDDPELVDLLQRRAGPIVLSLQWRAK